MTLNNAWKGQLKVEKTAGKPAGEGGVGMVIPRLSSRKPFTRLSVGEVAKMKLLDEHGLSLAEIGRICNRAVSTVCALKKYAFNYQEYIKAQRQRLMSYQTEEVAAPAKVEQPQYTYSSTSDEILAELKKITAALNRIEQAQHVDHPTEVEIVESVPKQAKYFWQQ